METLFKNDFFQIEFDEKNNLFKSVWFDTEQTISDNNIKEIITLSEKLIKEYTPKAVLANDRKRKFIYTVELQNWVALTLFNACIEAKVEKFAVILPSELVAEISTQQTA